MNGKPRPLAYLAVCAALCAPALAVARAPQHRPARPARTGHRARPGRARPASKCLVPGLGRPLAAVWHPHMLAAIGYQDHRSGDVAFAARTDTAFYGYRPDHQEWSASILKAMLMVAYLDQSSVANRPIDSYDDSLLHPMITVSDNNAADRVDEQIGARGLDALAARVGMTRFQPAEPIWGESLITPRDQTKFFLHIDSYIPARHRAYAMHLLASITPSQRWGVGQVSHKGWNLYFKGGWGSGTGLIDSQVALLTRGCARISIAVLTMHDPDHAYGEDTLKGMFARLLRGLPSGEQRGRHRRHAHR